MARNLSKRKGFTPENATAGIDTTLDDFQTHTDEDALENEKKDQADNDTKQGTVNTNEQDTILNGQEKKAEITQHTQLSLEGLLEEKQKKYDKRQENVWLPPEITRPLQAISKLVGKTNGGKSKVVEMALQEFFTNHPDIVEKALELYGN